MTIHSGVWHEGWQRLFFPHSFRSESPLGFNLFEFRALSDDNDLDITFITETCASDINLSNILLFLEDKIMFSVVTGKINRMEILLLLYSPPP